MNMTVKHVNTPQHHARTQHSRKQHSRIQYSMTGSRQNRPGSRLLTVVMLVAAPLRNVGLLLLASLFFTGVVMAEEPVAKSRLSGVAIGGHDTVAYHTLQKEPQADALSGEKSYTVTWKGAKWRFLSQESADKFAAEPEKYSPAFNGHCANALSLGEGLIRTDGTHWEIFGDQLYLFYAARGRNRWLATDDVTPYIEQATKAWNELK